MMAIVFSHRIDKKENPEKDSPGKKYNKPLDKFVLHSIHDNLIDFSVMRDTMYHYSSGVEQKFFSYSIECFYFIFYSYQQSKLNIPVTKSDAPF